MPRQSDELYSQEAELEALGSKRAEKLMTEHNDRSDEAEPLQEEMQMLWKMAFI